MAGPGKKDQGGSFDGSDFDSSFDGDFEPRPKAKKSSRPQGAPSPPDVTGHRNFSGQGNGPSFDDALDSLFNKSFGDVRSSTTVSSGDEDIDKAIDLAVDTLFVEDMDIPAPETAELEAQAFEPTQTETAPEATAREERRRPATTAAKATAEVSKTSRLEKFKRDEGVAQFKDTLFIDEPAPSPPPPPPPPRPKPAPPVAVEPPKPAPAPPRTPPSVPKAKPRTTTPQPAPVPPPQPKARLTPTPPEKMVEAPETKAIRKLQEAILTLEWEISKRSITILANELQRLKTKFKDDVTVDFAALTMRVVLDYVIRRLRRAHPESIRFLMEVTRLLMDGLDANRTDALGTFHEILSLYERYKSVVRKAEGLKDNESPHALRGLQVTDPAAFAQVVALHAHTIAEAGKSLASRIATDPDPENLVRSFRFLVTRSFNRILEGTQDKKPVRKQAPAKAAPKR